MVVWLTGARPLDNSKHEATHFLFRERASSRIPASHSPSGRGSSIRRTARSGLRRQDAMGPEWWKAEDVGRACILWGRNSGGNGYGRPMETRARAGQLYVTEISEKLPAQTEDIAVEFHAAPAVESRFRLSPRAIIGLDHSDDRFEAPNTAPLSLRGLIADRKDRRETPHAMAALGIAGVGGRRPHTYF